MRDGGEVWKVEVWNVVVDGVELAGRKVRDGRSDGVAALEPCLCSMLQELLEIAIAMALERHDEQFLRARRDGATGK